MKSEKTIYNVGFRQGSMADKEHENPYSIHTSPEWHKAWKDGYKSVHGHDSIIKANMLKRAQDALDICKNEEQPPASAMYNVLRYAKAGLYQVKDQK